LEFSKGVRRGKKVGASCGVWEKKRPLGYGGFVSQFVCPNQGGDEREFSRGFGAIYTGLKKEVCGSWEKTRGFGKGKLWGIRPMFLAHLDTLATTGKGG